ncbi:tripartite tricarboxylate transporter TctB family protein [Rhodovulum sulfidophilum]|uniref:tripartite tricarboxylate transporter TctB family protein n=1 Tax=Rhodovulum sulfidophilum TaxID=35806 RepID=UPI001924B02C|nr:tripartite tricarboxylate transporter TctB family protein [Rhodovulum sulfidophilum]MBL3575959.1 tripartite tricarboxylate transporter TctB family protein [Rhodovulum sulfidophilum]MCE8431862.1 tripartite tricarboxylate transporter TctB family protein [Rhodovulum sulfidophilum]MCF4115692.1 tripartite tricarboxylate transporter TctB family protein [Rhodovulum sulfidophilum]
MNRHAIELVAAGLFAGLFAVLLSQGIGYPSRSSYMPVAASGIGLTMCLFWSVKAVRLLAAGEGENIYTTRADLVRFGLILGGGMAYIVGFIWLGFFTSILILVPAMSRALGYRNWVVIAATTLGFAIVLYAVFRLLLAVPLPPEALLTLFGA